MMLDKATLDFLRQHWDDDPLKLLLQQSRYPDVDIRMAAQQIEGRQQARQKWPSLWEKDDFLYPPKLNREQSSSEKAAKHKAAIISHLGIVSPALADLTGGMGIDSLFFAQECSKVDYVERDAMLVGTMRENVKALGCDNLACHHADGMEWVSEHYDILYLDPARRDENGHKVKAFESCEPNILLHLDLLKSHCRYLVVKASPMIDIDLALSQLRDVKEVHIVAVDGECKEVLFVMDFAAPASQQGPLFCCADIRASRVHHNSFTREEENEAAVSFATSAKHYLYEPHAALMKGGAYKLLCRWYGIEKLARNTHLYTSDTLVDDFPGRVFEILEEVSLSAKELKKILPDGRCHLLCKNYPVTTAQLQKKLRLSEGGTHHLIATRLGERPTAFLCRHKITE